MAKYWTVKRGSWRTVVLIPKLGIAVKFPKIRIDSVVKEIKWMVKEKRWKLLWWFCTDKAKEPMLMKGLLLHGIMTNQSEYRFWRKTKNRFLWPTRFSFFGFFNIQRLGKQVLLSNEDVWEKLTNITAEVCIDKHCFRNRDNFTLTKDGKLRLLDYGSIKSQKVVTKHGDTFANINGLLEK